MLTNCFFGCFVGVLLLVTAVVTQESDTIVAAKSKKGKNLVAKEAGQKNNCVGLFFMFRRILSQGMAQKIKHFGSK